MADSSKIHTRELSFSISEDELGIELGIPMDHSDEDEDFGGGDPDEAEAITRLPPEAKKDWQLRPTARFLRGPLRDGVLKPVLRMFCKLHVLGRENFKGLAGPVIVAANHTSHFDTPVIFEVLPKQIRNKIATAAAADHWFKNAAKSILPGIAYGAIAFPRKGSMGLKHCIDLLQKGWSVLIFPEGTRSASGDMHGFKLGCGRMAVTTKSAIVPLHIRGLQKILPKEASLPRRGDVWIAVGQPIHPEVGETAEEITLRLQESVKALGLLLDPYDQGHPEGPVQPETPGLY